MAWRLPFTGARPCLSRWICWSSGWAMWDCRSPGSRPGRPERPGLRRQSARGPRAERGKVHVDGVSDEDMAPDACGRFRGHLRRDNFGAPRVVVVLRCRHRWTARAARPVHGDTRPPAWWDAICVSGMLVVLESTTFPGTTDDIVRPVLEESGLCAGGDFARLLARTLSTRDAEYGVHASPPQGRRDTPRAARRAMDFYERFVVKVVWRRAPGAARWLRSPGEHLPAESSIALVQRDGHAQPRVGCRRLGCHRLRDDQAASASPPSSPAPARGRPACIPIDPRLSVLPGAGPGPAVQELIDLAQEINDGMPRPSWTAPPVCSGARVPSWPVPCPCPRRHLQGGRLRPAGVSRGRCRASSEESGRRGLDLRPLRPELGRRRRGRAVRRRSGHRPEGGRSDDRAAVALSTGSMSTAPGRVCCSTPGAGSPAATSRSCSRVAPPFPFACPHFPSSAPSLPDGGQFVGITISRRRTAGNQLPD